MKIKCLLITLFAFVSTVQADKKLINVTSKNGGLIGYRNISQQNTITTSGYHIIDLECSDPGLRKCKVNRGYDMDFNVDGIRTIDIDRVNTYTENIEYMINKGQFSGSFSHKFEMRFSAKIKFYNVVWNYDPINLETSIRVEIDEISRKNLFW